MRASRNEEAKQELYKLGAEYREDWSDFDGRMFLMEVNIIADKITGNEKAKEELFKLGAAYRADWSLVVLFKWSCVMSQISFSAV